MASRFQQGGSREHPQLCLGVPAGSAGRLTQRIYKGKLFSIDIRRSTSGAEEPGALILGIPPAGL